MEIRIAKQLMEAYRKQRNYSISQLITTTEGTPICSRTTYGKLLKGDTRDDEDIIYDIFERLKRPLRKLPFNLDFQPLSKAMEYSFNEQAAIECQKLLDMLEPYKTYALYDVYYRQLKYILNYYQNDVCPSEDDVLREFDFMPLVEKELCDLVYVVFMYSHNRGNLQNIDECEGLLLNKSGHVLALIFEFCYYSNELKYGACIKMLDKIDKKIDKENRLTLLYFLPYKIRVYQESNISYKFLLTRTHVLIRECIDMIPTKKKNTIYINLMIIYLYRKEYNDALNLLNLVEQVGGIRKIHLEIYKMFCLSQLGISNGVSSDFEKKLYTQYPDVIDVYEYFTNKELSLKYRNKKLIKIAKDKLHKDDELYFFMFEEEITKNCDQLNRYKDIRDFKMVKEAKMSEK